MNNDKLKELVFKLLDIAPYKVVSEYLENDITIGHWVWLLGNYKVIVSMDSEIKINIYINGEGIMYPRPLELTEKEHCEIKLKLLNLIEQFQNKVLKELSELSRYATLNNQMEGLLEETEYEKTHKNDE